MGDPPSLAHPTIELRVADSCTRLDDAIAIATLFRCLVRAIDRDRNVNAGFDRVGRAITAENKWKAQRHGMAATFVEPFTRQPVSVSEWLAAVREFIEPEIAAFGCGAEIAHLDRIMSDGSSADRQAAIYKQAIADGQPRSAAIRQVIDWAATTTLATGILASAA